MGELAVRPSRRQDRWWSPGTFPGCLPSPRAQVPKQEDGWQPCEAAAGRIEETRPSGYKHLLLFQSLLPAASMPELSGRLPPCQFKKAWKSRCLNSGSPFQCSSWNDLTASARSRSFKAMLTAGRYRKTLTMRNGAKDQVTERGTRMSCFPDAVDAALPSKALNINIKQLRFFPVSWNRMQAERLSFCTTR